MNNVNSNLHNCYISQCNMKLHLRTDTNCFCKCLLELIITKLVPDISTRNSRWTECNAFRYPTDITTLPNLNAMFIISPRFCNHITQSHMTRILKLEFLLFSRFQRPRSLRRRSAADHLLGLWVRIPPGAWMYVPSECCVLSARGLCYGPIPRPE